MTLQNSTFIENRVYLFTGGGIFWENISLIANGITMFDNYAPNGPNVMSNAVKVNLARDRMLEYVHR